MDKTNTEHTILIVGTYDTKDSELIYLASIIRAQGANVLIMDVSVLGDPSQPTDISKHEVTQAAGKTIQQAIDLKDENLAMQIMAKGSSMLTVKLYGEGKFSGVLVLGGTMGTDVALDVCAALPLGVPKYIVSTVSFSPLIPPERLAADVQMILWAGGLYGLNSVCRASLSQAAGAVLGAARAVEKPDNSKPLIGMTSFGKTVLRYMVTLKPALEERGFEVAVFHATGMGGRAFESLAAEGKFACVFDFATQEVGNHLFGSKTSAGADRLTAAGRVATPQIISAGCYDLVDISGWQPIPEVLCNLPNHAHNRLLTSVVLNSDMRRQVAKAHCNKLSQAKGATTLLLPNKGFNEWDRSGADLHNIDGLEAFIEEFHKQKPDNVTLVELDTHINDDEFSSAALKVFDEWLAAGIVKSK